MADSKVPREVSLHAEFPRDAAGKLIKRILRDPYWAGRASRVQEASLTPPSPPAGEKEKC